MPSGDAGSPVHMYDQTEYLNPADLVLASGGRWGMSAGNGERRGTFATVHWGHILASMTPERLRLLAEEARSIADAMKDATAREMMRRVAEGYDRLAERVARHRKDEANACSCC
jgi:hypothetical protein